jgi:hypothetical protein
MARALSGVDMAWVFQPYLACCAAAVSLCLYALVEPVVSSVRVRALIAFLAAQSALLYGYSLWGGLKELTAAFLLALAVALAAPLLRGRPRQPGQMLPLAIAAAALIQALGVGAGAWIALIFVAVCGPWLYSAWRAGALRGAAKASAWLLAMTAVLIVPVWVVLGEFFSNDSYLFSSGQSEATRMGNLIHPLSPFQLVGIWPTGDFRLTPPGLPTVLLVGLALLAAAVALWAAVRSRQLGLPLYIAIALGGCLLFFLGGATPWVVGKTLAISAPALLVTALVGAVMLWKRRRAAALVLAALAFGVLWSNVLAYHDVLLAPRPRLAELQRIGSLVSGKGPTLLNEYEIYADEHFLRTGAPVEPADYRSVPLALRNGALLTKTAWADLDSFPLATLEEYPSIVTRRSPAESRPPSNYRLVWQGRYYSLWQRPAGASTTVLAHLPLGESNAIPYCGASQNDASGPECSVNPVATPPCAQIQELARRAEARGAKLVAHQQAEPIVARGDETLWPGRWLHDPAGHTLTATTPGAAIAHIALASSQRYQLWLGGSFARGFEVSVDGRSVGKVKDELSTIGGYVHVADPFLTAGTHTFKITYPHSDLTPGSGDNTLTSLSAISLLPTAPPSELITVSPPEAGRLCGRPLDWIEIVAGAS